MGVDPGARSELLALRDVRVREEASILNAFARDQSHLAARPSFVVAPASVEGVARVVAWARRHRVPLVARGSGTSLEGESVPSEGGVVVDLQGWSRVLEIDPVERTVRVEPGVVNYELQEALRPHGLFFPPNPGSWRSSTIGGNVATNASGPRSFRYGSVRRWVRAVEVVLGTGATASLGSRVEKRSVGPDLVGLLVGSEGTLGILTQLTLALAPLPARRMGLVVPIGERASLGSVVAALRPLAGAGLSAVEYLDRACASALARTEGARLPGDTPLLLLELESADEAEEARRAERLLEVLRAVGATDEPTVAPSADRLWSLRGESGVALDRELGARVREDIAVPVGQLDAMLRALEEIARAEGVRCVTFGHLGEASLHPNLLVAPGTEPGERVRARVLRACLALGGTVSAEHGVGAVKPAFLGEEIGRPGLELLRAVKRACDPDGILNPGKLYPSSE